MTIKTCQLEFVTKEDKDIDPGIVVTKNQLQSLYQKGFDNKPAQSNMSHVMRKRICICAVWSAPLLFAAWIV